MIRILFLLISFINIGYAQKPTLKLVYEQTVTDESKKEKSKVKDVGLLNSFQPLLLSYIESESEIKKEVYIDKNQVYTETFLPGQNGKFSLKLKNKSGTWYINEITGEQKKFDEKKLRLTNVEVPTKMKLKGSGIDEKTGFEYDLYKAKSKDLLIEYQVSKDIQLDKTSSIHEGLFYKKNLILQYKKVFREKGKEIVLKLVSIDTIFSDKNFIEERISKGKELAFSNNHLKEDSINFNEEIADIFIKKVKDDQIFSLNDYKNNGKYLMIDFWGTWCKPCIAAMPELKLFYEKHIDQIDLLSLNYKDTNQERVKEKIKEIGMNWDQGVATEKVNKVLNPETYFPGIVMFDDDMKLVLRESAKTALESAEKILEKEKE